MSRGLYALTSGMLTQQRKIDIASNNISNLNTTGYKKEKAITTNFGNLLINKSRQNGIYAEDTPISNVSIIRTIEGNNVIHSQGSLSETGSATDFAIMGEGFFSIENNENIVYTRRGSFNLDEEGYLTLKDVGRVQGEYGDLYIGTDKFNIVEDGSIIVGEEVVDKISIYDFYDYNSLNKVGEGLFSSAEEANLVEYPQIANNVLERSNVNITEELTDIISSQRALQTASQLLKIYDLIQEKAVNEIGKIN